MAGFGDSWAGGLADFVALPFRLVKEWRQPTCAEREAHARSMPYYNEAVTKYNAKNYRGTVADCNAALYLEKNPLTNYLRGLAYHHLEEHQKAIEDFNIFLKSNPDENKAIALFFRGASKYRLKQYAAAIKDLDASIALRDDDPYSYSWRGCAKQDADDLVGAIKDFDRAITLKPDYADALRLKGQAEAALARARPAAAAGAGGMRARSVAPVRPAAKDFIPTHARWLSEREYQAFIACIRRSIPCEAQEEAGVEAESFAFSVWPASVEQTRNEMAYLRTNPYLFDYYCVFQNVLYATVMGAMSIRVGMASATAASGLDSKAQQGIKYINIILSHLPVIKELSEPLKGACDYLIGIDHDNKARYLLSCFPIWSRAHQVIERLARGITLCMREALKTEDPDSRGFIRRAISSLKTRLDNQLYFNDLETPTKARAFLDAQLIALLMMSGSALTASELTAEYVVATFLNPGQAILPSPVAKGVDVAPVATVAVEPGASAETVSALEARLIAERAAREALEERLRQLEAAMSHRVERTIPVGRQAMVQVARHAESSWHDSAIHRLTVTTEQHGDALRTIVAKMTGVDAAAAASAADTAERGELFSGK